MENEERLANLRAISAKAKSLQQFVEGDNGFGMILDEMEKGYINQWANSGATEIDLREQLYCSVKTIRDVKGIISLLYKDGDDAIKKIYEIVSAEVKGTDSEIPYA